MTIWTIEQLHQTKASFIRLLRAMDKDLPKQSPGESAKITLRNLQTAAALGVQEVIIVSENGEAVAIATVRNDEAASIGNARLLYVVPGVESTVSDMLLQEVFERVWHNPAIRNFDGQTFVDQPDIRTAFAARGIQPIARQNMQLSQLAFRADQSVPALPNEFRIAPWWPEPGVSIPDGHLDALSDLILVAYHGTLDEKLYPGMNTRAGLRQFFENILYDKHSAFDHEASRIIYTTDSTEKMVGQIFCSQTRARHIFVLEFAIHPAYRRQGLGRILLMNAIRTAADRGLAGVQLGVTMDNPARQLYESIGFESTTHFWVYAGERPEINQESLEENA